jgi:hypothetical protein
MTVSGNGQKTMKRVVVDHFGGPEVLKVVEDDVPQPGQGEVGVRVLAAGVSFTDAQLRAGTYLGVPKPPFTPGYDLRRCGAFAEPSDGLEPSTPSLPCDPDGNRWQPVATVWR